MSKVRTGSTTKILLLETLIISMYKITVSPVFFCMDMKHGFLIKKVKLSLCLNKCHAMKRYTLLN